MVITTIPLKSALPLKRPGQDHHVGLLQGYVQPILLSSYNGSQLC